ncbi:VOC family protein [Hoeflea sp.]|uniref:VOC family protein n=1 Tax=Hoeflea sp. TaxID=1940281 RepID=UPI003B01CFF1
MFSHVNVGCSDLDRASAFYDAVLSCIGLVRRDVEPDGGPPIACWVQPGTSLPRFFVCLPFNEQPASAGNGSMVAFKAMSREAIDNAHAAGLKAGGSCEGAPGLRTHYAADYYGAYLRDPDGNKIHLVHRDYFNE